MHCYEFVLVGVGIGVKSARTDISVGYINHLLVEIKTYFKIIRLKTLTLHEFFI